MVATRFHTVRSLDEDPRIVQNRNALLWLYPDATGVKTGFTTPAGFCIVAAAEREDRRLVAVVLGEPGEPFSDAAALLNYGFEGFEQPGAGSKRHLARSRCGSRAATWRSRSTGPSNAWCRWTRR